MAHLEAFVVQRRSHAMGAYLLEPERGVVARAFGMTEATSRARLAAELGEEVIGYVELALSRETAPGLAKHRRGDGDGEGLAAAVRLANERLHDLAASKHEGVALSLVALHAQAGRATLVSAGPDARAWRLRADVLDELAPLAAASIGSEAQLAPTMRELELRSGDLFGLGPALGPEVAALRRNAGRLDEALAACAALPVVGRWPLVLARWVG